MEKEIGPTAAKEPKEGGGVLNEKARSRFLKGKVESGGLAGELKTLAFFASVFVLGFAAMQFAAAEKYDISVLAIEEGGEIDSDAAASGLDFGSLPRGDSSIRFITVKNGGENDAYVKICKWGAASRFLEADRDGFTLKAGESKNLEFTIKVPSKAEEKRYTGNLAIFEIPLIF